jgi:hypothetical protein
VCFRRLYFFLPVYIQLVTVDLKIPPLFTTIAVYHLLFVVEKGIAVAISLAFYKSRFQSACVVRYIVNLSWPLGLNSNN